MTSKKTIKFFAKRPNMEISIDGKVYPFHGGELEVDLKLAEQLKKHHLYKKSHIFCDDDAIVVNGKVEAIKDNPRMQDLSSKVKKNKELSIFSFPARTSVIVDAGPYKIQFEDGKAAVGKKEADSLRKHIFFRHGKIVELEVSNG